MIKRILYALTPGKTFTGRLNINTRVECEPIMWTSIIRSRRVTVFFCLFFFGLILEQLIFNPHIHCSPGSVQYSLTIH